MSLIYLDNNATTRPDPRVIESMFPYWQTHWGNPSSLHRFGGDVRQAVDVARKNVAELIGARRPTEIIFTSGGTESNHLAIRGLLASNPEKKHILTTQVEHPSVLELCKRLEKESYDVTYLPVNADGELDLNLLAKSIRNDTALASIMWANNETGVLFPIEKIAPIFAEKGIPLHVDATQVCGKLPIDVAPLPISALTIAAHKFHGPKGIGALYLRRGTSLRPQLLGGSQERSLRAGTENVAGIVGLGKTAELAKENIKKNCFKTAGLRDILESKILSNFSLAKRNGSPKNRLPNTASIRFEGLDGEDRKS